MKKPARYYERMIVACAFMLLFVNVGFTSTAFSVYQPYIVDLPGVGNVGGSFVVTIRTLVALICMFLTNMYFKAINPRLGIFLATMCSCLAFMAFAFVENMVGLCIGGVLAGLGYGFGGMVASTYLIGNWFKGKVGSVSGTVAMGSGIAAVVVPLCAGWIIESVSLQAAFFVEGAAALLVAILLLVFVRMSPEDVGMHPIEKADRKEVQRESEYRKQGRKYCDSQTESQETTQESPLEESSETTQRESAPAPAKTWWFLRPKGSKIKLAEFALPRIEYVGMIVAIILLGGISVAGYNYFGILLTTQGIDPMVAATLISVAGIFLTVSKFAVGAVCDRFGTLFGSFVFFVLLIASLVLCSLVGSGGVLEAAIAAVMLGVGMPLGTTGISLWSLELSSPEQMLSNIRRFQLAYAFGGFAFNMMPGLLSQATGSYATSYEVLTLMAIPCAAIILTVYTRHIFRARREFAKRPQE